MALLLSCDEIQDYEDGMFYAVLISSKNHSPEFVVPIEEGWLSKPLSKQSYFITHIVKDFHVEDVISRYNNYIKEDIFEGVVRKIIKNVIDIQI